MPCDDTKQEKVKHGTLKTWKDKSETEGRCELAC